MAVSTEVEVAVAMSWRVSMTLILVFGALSVTPVLSQGIGSQTGPVSFSENYESQSDAQHFKLLSNGQQAQLVLDEYSGM